jgi:signal transduction histidine kinase
MVKVQIKQLPEKLTSVGDPIELLRRFMTWAIDIRKILNSEFRGLYWRLLLYYLIVVAVILGVFSAGVYTFFGRSLYRQLDQKLQTLAQAAAPTYTKVEARGSQYLDNVKEVPWRDIFNRNQQSLEWYNTDGELLASKGTLSPDFPPQVGPQIGGQASDPNRVRTYTVSVFSDLPNQNSPDLEGYIRASQPTEEIEEAKTQLLWGLATGGVVALGLATGGGLWLTQKALEPVEKNVGQLRQFTADASHELRSPLAAIKTSVDVVQNHPERIHPKDAKKLTAIAGATAQMNGLVEDLLFLARADAGASTSLRDWKPISLNQILRNVVELFEPSAQTKGITLKSDLPVEVELLGNPDQLSRLFSNLLGNGIHYTPSGGSVNLSLAKQHRFCLVSIQDTGIGIAPQHLSSVFDRFWRADKARSRREGGTGLGLPIANAIAQHHGGRITITSQVKVGSCFQVRLPLPSHSSLRHS